MKISIIGGTSGFGLWLAKYIKNNFSNEEVIITGRNLEKGKAAIKGTLLIYENNNEKAISDADIVIFSVPISYMEETIKQLAPKVKKDAILVDVCSIKGFPAKTMQKYAPKGTLIIPIHPMFGPYIHEIVDQIFVLTPLDENIKKDKRYIFLKDFLNKKNAKIIETTPVYHDKMMAVVQGLTHLSMFSIGETIKRLGIDIEDSLNFVSPIYKLMISSVARYVGHDGKLYGDIQMYNTEILDVHKNFMEVLKDFNQTIINKNEDNFLEILNGTKQYFGDNLTNKGQKYTDKIIFLMGKQIEKINKFKGKKIILENIYTGENIEDIFKEIKDDKIILEQYELNLNEWVLN